MKKKKEQHPGLSKSERLKMARIWVANYKGEEIVKTYAKTFGLNLNKALKDLQSIECKISTQEQSDITGILKERQQKKDKRKMKRISREHGDGVESDDTFAFIAGYTTSGVPFGIKWDEVEG